MDFIIKGFPDQISDYIELPDMAELLFYPTFNRCHIDTYLRHCSEFQKSLFEKAPIKGDTKNIYIYSDVKILSPNLTAIYGVNGKPHDWHIDQKRLRDKSETFDKRFHLMVSPCHARTEFNISEGIVIKDAERFAGIAEFNDYLNENETIIGLEARKIEPNRFVTFDSHIHRAVPTDRLEFRFFFSVEESNEINYNENQVLDRTMSYRVEDRSGVMAIVRASNGKSIFIDYNEILKPYQEVKNNE